MQFNKLFWILLLSVGGLSSCTTGPAETSGPAQNEEKAFPIVQESSLKLQPEKGVFLYQGRPFTGASVAYYPNGIKATQTIFLDGKKHGTCQKWFEDGTLSFESSYLAGKQHGMTHTWWRNGNLRSTSRFEQGVPHGVQEQWYVSGAKFKRRKLEQGHESGLQQSWRENGKLYNNYEAKNGRIFGLKRAALCYQLNDETLVQ